MSMNCFKKTLDITGFSSGENSHNTDVMNQHALFKDMIATRSIIDTQSARRQKRKNPTRHQIPNFVLNRDLIIVVIFSYFLPIFKEPSK